MFLVELLLAQEGVDELEAYRLVSVLLSAMHYHCQPKETKGAARNEPRKHFGYRYQVPGSIH